MKLIEAAKAHFGGLKRVRVEVPEWGPEDEPFIIYAKPMTVGDREAIRERGHVDQPTVMVDTLLQKAEDEAGTKLFEAKDRHALTHEVDGRVVNRIALAILAGPTDEELEKNSGAASGSSSSS